MLWLVRPEASVHTWTEATVEHLRLCDTQVSVSSLGQALHWNAQANNSDP